MDGNFKKVYNRPAPYRADSTLKVMVAKSTLPAYPSADTVVAGVTVELLKLLFPGDQDYIQHPAITCALCSSGLAA